MALAAWEEMERRWQDDDAGSDFGDSSQASRPPTCADAGQDSQSFVILRRTCTVSLPFHYDSKELAYKTTEPTAGQDQAEVATLPFRE